MHVHICMYACMHVCMYICVYVRTYVRVYVYVCMYVCKHTILTRLCVSPSTEHPPQLPLTPNSDFNRDKVRGIMDRDHVTHGGQVELQKRSSGVCVKDIAVRTIFISWIPAGQV